MHDAALASHLIGLRFADLFGCAEATVRPLTREQLGSIGPAAGRCAPSVQLFELASASTHVAPDVDASVATATRAAVSAHGAVYQSTAIAYDQTSGRFMLARPGAPPVAWALGDTWTQLSPTRKVFAVGGVLAGNAGVYALSFASGAAQTFSENGSLIATTDTSVYFGAPDGLCVGPVP